LPSMTLVITVASTPSVGTGLVLVTVCALGATLAASEVALLSLVVVVALALAGFTANSDVDSVWLPVSVLTTIVLSTTSVLAISLTVCISTHAETVLKSFFVKVLNIVCVRSTVVGWIAIVVLTDTETEAEAGRTLGASAVGTATVALAGITASLLEEAKEALAGLTLCWLVVLVTGPAIEVEAART